MLCTAHANTLVRQGGGVSEAPINALVCATSVPLHTVKFDPRSAFPPPPAYRYPIWRPRLILLTPDRHYSTTKKDVFAPDPLAQHLSRAADVLRVPWSARPDSRPLVTPQDVTNVCKVRHFSQEGGERGA